MLSLTIGATGCGRIRFANSGVMHRRINAKTSFLAITFRYTPRRECEAARIRIEALSRANLFYAIPSSHQRHARQSNEQAVLDYAGNISQGPGQGGWVFDLSEAAIEDLVPVIGVVRAAVGSRAEFCGSAQARNLLFDHRTGEGNNLDRQRKLSENRYQLCRVSDHYHLLRSSSDDFFAQKRAASTFDQVQLGIDFIRAVDVDIDDGMLVERAQRDADGAGEFSSGVRCRDADHLQARSYAFAESQDSEIGGGTGAEADDVAISHQF